MLINRFKQSFPVAYTVLLNTKLQFVICSLITVLAYVFSLHFCLASVLFYYLLLSYSTERRHLQSMLFTPLTILALSNFLYAGVGVTFLTISNNYEFDLYLFLIQSAAVVTFPFTILIYTFITKDVPALSLPDPNITKSKSFYKRLKILAWIIFIYGFTGLLVGAITGAGDRGVAGDFIVETRYGIWSAFVIFGRLNYISFITLPLILKDSKFKTRLLIFILLAIYFIYTFAAGGRGALLYPFVFFGIGYWLFGGKAHIIKQSLVIFIAASLFLIPFMDSFRNTSAFRYSALSNPLERLSSSVTETSEAFGSNESQDNLFKIGRSLMASSDMYIYEYTPADIPFAGWENIDAALYVWIPDMIFPGKPLLLDGNQIASTYTGIKHDRSSSNISFNADMYRRFGWFGIFIGNICFALFYACVIRYSFLIYSQNNSLVGFAFILLTFTFFINTPLSTLLGTIWIWLWDIPKYVLLFFAIDKITKMFVKN